MRHIETITYFNDPSEKDAEIVLALVKKRAEDLLTRDFDDAKFSEILKGYNLIIVTHHADFRESEPQNPLEENRRVIEADSGEIFAVKHIFTWVEKAMRNKFNTTYPAEMMAKLISRWRNSDGSG
ncbi:MAG: hypothetical protein N3E47_02540 [Candidatus Bathyarchaeota archaeon]|nr:hypothetical protein [Candidatus Bathyarchaeota archaeon]